MKLHHVSKTTLAGLLTAAVLLAGAANNATAADRGIKKVTARSATPTKTRGKQNLDRRTRTTTITTTKSTTVSRNARNYDRRVTKALPVKKVVRYAPKKVIRHNSPSYVRALPRGARVIRHGNDNYYYSSGRYYRHHPVYGWEIVSAPRFYALPPYARRIFVNHTPYWVYDNVYYHWCDGYYEICEVPYVENSITFQAGPFSVTLRDYD
ncbi:MAG: hypothetical protein JW863_21070 [Chitinispirillaceae bacterium]|nr:hypothetical protein [Chitinispirillaceae bacterium]